jgi:hypothetical protein
MLPKRRHPAKGVIKDDRTPTLIFLNVCTANRKPWLADSHGHETLVEVWHSATHWEVGPYILMPDHLHLLPGQAMARRLSIAAQRCITSRVVTAIDPATLLGGFGASPHQNSG